MVAGGAAPARSTGSVSAPGDRTAPTAYPSGATGPFRGRPCALARARGGTRGVPVILDQDPIDAAGRKRLGVGEGAVQHRHEVTVVP
jgi:hypothetical protein